MNKTLHKSNNLFSQFDFLYQTKVCSAVALSQEHAGANGRNLEINNSKTKTDSAHAQQSTVATADRDGKASVKTLTPFERLADTIKEVTFP